jgi:hypothetical protein
MFTHPKPSFKTSSQDKLSSHPQSLIDLLEISLSLTVSFCANAIAETEHHTDPRGRRGLQ